MLGREVDVEESAIAEEFQKLARIEKEQVLPSLAQARALNLPFVPPLAAWVESLEAVSNSQSDDCVRMLAGEGRSLREQRETVHQISSFLADKKNLQTVERARSVIREQAPLLARSTGQEITEVQVIETVLADTKLPNRIHELAQAAQEIDCAYHSRFAEQHKKRLDAYRRATDAIRLNPEFLAVDTSLAESVLNPLLRRAVEAFEVPPGYATDRATGNSLATLEEDLDLLPSLEAGALGRLAQIRNAQQEKEGVEIIRLSDFLPKTQALNDYTDEEIERVLDNLRQKLYNLRELKRPVLWD
jgi:hypothetical protein